MEDQPMKAKILVYHDMAILIDEFLVPLERFGYGGSNEVDKAIGFLSDLCKEMGMETPVVIDNRQQAAARRVKLRRQLRRLGQGEGIDGLDEAQLQAKLKAVGN
jgi:hypothetical protein